MPLPSSAHAAVQAERKAMRNAGARANRIRVAGVKVLQATDAEGRKYTLCLGDKEPSRAYVLRRDKKTGALVCDGFMAKWKGGCVRIEAAEFSAQAALPQDIDEAGKGEQEHGQEGQHQHQQHDQIEPPGLGRRAAHVPATLQSAGQGAVLWEGKTLSTWYSRWRHAPCGAADEGRHN